MLQHEKLMRAENNFLTSHGITLNSGLQYTDTAYVAAILCILVPVSVGSLGFCFIGNTKHLRYLVSAIYGSVCSFFYVLIWQCNLDISAEFGVTSSLIVLVLAATISAFYTREFAWPVMIQWLILVIYSTLFQFIACLTTLKIGLLVFLPGYLTAPVHYQFAFQMIFFSALTIITYLFLCFTVGLEEKFGKRCNNCVTSYIAAYFIVTGISYLSLLTGLLPNSEFDPIGLFGTPSPLRLMLHFSATDVLQVSATHSFHLYGMIYPITGLIFVSSFVVIFLGYIGWTTQERRDNFLKARRVKKKMGFTENADYSDAVSYLLKNESEKDVTLSV